VRTVGGEAYFKNVGLVLGRRHCPGKKKKETGLKLEEGLSEKDSLQRKDVLTAGKKTPDRGSFLDPSFYEEGGRRGKSPP